MWCAVYNFAVNALCIYKTAQSERCRRAPAGILRHDRRRRYDAWVSERQTQAQLQALVSRSDKRPEFSPAGLSVPLIYSTPSPPSCQPLSTHSIPHPTDELRTLPTKSWARDSINKYMFVSHFELLVYLLSLFLSSIRNLLEILLQTWLQYTTRF